MSILRAIIVICALVTAVCALIIFGAVRHDAKWPRKQKVQACIEFDSDDSEYSHEPTVGMVCDTTQAGSLPAHITCCTP